MSLPLFSRPQARQPLRDYQERAVRGVLDAYQRARSVCLVAPTGSGKTRMGEELVHLATGRGRRVLWMAHRRELVKQAADRLRLSLGHLEVGVVSPGHEYSPASPVQVATVQTLIARGDRPPADLIVFDEAHHYASDDWRQLARAYPEARSLGLTATPERGDGRPLGDLFSELVVAAQYSELIAAGHIVPAQVLEPEANLEDGLACDITSAYTHYASGMLAFAFVRSVEEAYSGALSLRQAGWSAAVIEANTPAAEREQTLELFAARKIKVLVSVNTLTEGVDIPEAECAILARKFGHESGFLQACGRVLRAFPGKTHATVLDLVGNWKLHGVPDEDREYSLAGDSGVRRKGATPLTQCLRCGAVSQAHVSVCPVCGFERPKRELAPQVIHNIGLVPVGGELVSLPPGASADEVYAELRRRQLGEGRGLDWVVAAFKRRFGYRPTLDDVTAVERVAEWERLRSISAVAGRRPRWVDEQYAKIFGERPPVSGLVAARIAARIGGTDAARI